MEYIIIVIISIIVIILLKVGFNIKVNDIKEIKKIGEDKNLNKIAQKFPENIEICNSILKKLKNNNVQIEENNETKTSLYIALTNKIIIAKISDTFTRIQTIAHECLHSVQNRKILIFNFIFSNIFLISFIVFAILLIFNIGNNMIYLQTYTLFAIIYITIRGYLENEAMSKAMYIAKEYMQEYTNNKEEISREDTDILVTNFEKINKIGIPLTNFWLVTGCMVKLIILSLIALI